MADIDNGNSTDKSRDYAPYIVSWNLTGQCNLFCPHCYMDARKRAAGELTTLEAKGVIDGLYQLNPNIMLVLTGGEPMMRDDIYEIVEYASSKGFITVMGSNGTLLTKDNLKRLKNAGLKGLGISIDSVTPTYHDSFRLYYGAWNLSIDALKFAREVGLQTQVDVTVMDKNCNDLDGFVDMSVGLGAKAVNFFFLVCTGRARKEFISTENYETALRKIATISDTEKRLMVRARCAPHIYRILHEDSVHIPQGTRGCLAGRSYMRVDPVGNVTACPYMPDNLGNVKERSVVDIWTDSPKLTLLRDGQYKGRCGRCEYTEICGGCRARALAQHGDFMEEDSLCLYEPTGHDKVTGKDKVELDDNFQGSIQWDDAAKARMKRTPAFMRNMIIGLIEKKANEKGIAVITSDFVDEIKSQDYSRMHGKKT
ncbi:MAG: radical SAM protein [Nitrospirae bacterium]|nr:radical SAM protein [Nitrospirota bacterium]